MSCYVYILFYFVFCPKVHRVMMPEADRTEHARRSIAFFVIPDMGTMVQPLDGLDKYPAIEGHEFVQKRVRGNEYKYVWL